MIKRSYRHGWEKYKLTKEYLKSAAFFLGAIIAVCIMLTAFLWFIDKEKKLDFVDAAITLYFMLGGIPFTLATPFIAAEIQMKRPDSKCWGYLKNSGDDGWIVPVFLWGVAAFTSAYFKDAWFTILAALVACYLCNKYLEDIANRYDLIEYIEAVGYAVGIQYEMKKDISEEKAKELMDEVVKNQRKSNPDFEPIYLQDLEGKAYEEAKAKLRVK